MAKFPHDDFAKAYLTELLSTIGKAVPNRPLKAETHIADLWFQLQSNSMELRSQLGLLGRILTKDALIEVFRNPATPGEIRACKSKLFSLEKELLRKATRRQKSLPEADLPLLLLLMPTASAEIREGFGAVKTEVQGVYELPRLERSILVALQLTKTEDTLWLRLLGRAGEQKRAIAEFADLPAEIPLHVAISDLLADYRAILETRGTLTPDEEELVMNLSAAYLKKRQEWKQEGRQEGQLEGIYKVARNLLRQGMDVELVVKATELTMEQITRLREQLEE